MKNDCKFVQNYLTIKKQGDKNAKTFFVGIMKLDEFADKILERSFKIIM